MPSLYNYDRFQACLFELESALCSTAQRSCKGLHADTQLSAAIYALLRATSLFRAALTLLESGLMDASDVVRRACWEAWMLGYEFRIKTSSSHSARWHFEKHRHSKVDHNTIKAFESSYRLAASRYRADYGGLTEVSHPTKSAAENSLVTVTSLHGNSGSIVNLQKARETLRHEDAPGIMYFLIWTMVVESADMISVEIKPEAIPLAMSFYSDYENLNPHAGSK